MTTNDRTHISDIDALAQAIYDRMDEGMKSRPQNPQVLHAIVLDTHPDLLPMTRLRIRTRLLDLHLENLPR